MISPVADHMELGYCLTYKEASAKKFDHVLFICPNFPFITRNTIYTILTRATKKCTILVPDLEDFDLALSREIKWSDFQTMIGEKFRDYKIFCDM
jgi:ATP-dependent exoDNAse (exonuclease V) alpha subunit